MRKARHRPSADGGDREGGLAEREAAHHGRADLVAGRAGGGAADGHRPQAPGQAASRSCSCPTSWRSCSSCATASPSCADGEHIMTEGHGRHDERPADPGDGRAGRSKTSSPRCSGVRGECFLRVAHLKRDRSAQGRQLRGLRRADPGVCGAGGRRPHRDHARHLRGRPAGRRRNLHQGQKGRPAQSPGAAIRHGIAFLTEDRKGPGARAQPVGQDQHDPGQHEAVPARARC